MRPGIGMRGCLRQGRSEREMGAAVDCEEFMQRKQTEFYASTTPGVKQRAEWDGARAMDAETRVR